jgi:hypothetical protein
MKLSSPQAPQVILSAVLIYYAAAQAWRYEVRRFGPHKEEATLKLPLRVAPKIPVPGPDTEHPKAVGAIIIRAGLWRSVGVCDQNIFRTLEVCEVFPS